MKGGVDVIHREEIDVQIDRGSLRGGVLGRLRGWDGVFNKTGKDRKGVKRSNKCSV